MRYASITDRLADLAGAKWAIHARGRTMKKAGADVIELTIGEPDVPTPKTLIDQATQSMTSGRTGYSSGRGEPDLVKTIASRYSQRRGRPISAEQV
ncbi:MAG: pyridoxal phosphate-dependent aminotransferase, partial [Paracoccaceae bacterium]